MFFREALIQEGGSSYFFLFFESVKIRAENSKNKAANKLVYNPLAALSEKRDSNPRPSACEADALPTELFSHWFCKYSNFSS